MSGGQETIRIGMPSEQLIIRSRPLEFTVPIGIDEESLIDAPEDGIFDVADAIDEIDELDGEING